MTYAEALRVLEIFKERDYVQQRPHFYVQSRKLNQWVRPKGMRILASAGQIAIQHWDSEEWEVIPMSEFNVGLW